MLLMRFLFQVESVLLHCMTAFRNYSKGLVHWKMYLTKVYKQSICVLESQGFSSQDVRKKIDYLWHWDLETTNALWPNLVTKLDRVLPNDQVVLRGKDSSRQSRRYNIKWKLWVGWRTEWWNLQWILRWLGFHVQDHSRLQSIHDVFITLEVHRMQIWSNVLQWSCPTEAKTFARQVLNNE